MPSTRSTATCASSAISGSKPARPLPTPLPAGVEVPDVPTTPFLLIHPFSRGHGKSLPVETLTALCQALSDLPIVIAGRSDIPFIAPPPSRFRHQLTNLLNRTTLPQLIWLIRRAAYTLSVDSGPMHIASAITDRLLALHTWSDPRLVGPHHPHAWIWKGRTFYRADAGPQIGTLPSVIPTPADAQSFAESPPGAMAWVIRFLNPRSPTSIRDRLTDPLLFASLAVGCILAACWLTYSACRFLGLFGLFPLPVPFPRWPALCRLYRRPPPGGGFSPKPAAGILSWLWDCIALIPLLFHDWYMMGLRDWVRSQFTIDELRTMAASVSKLDAPTAQNGPTPSPSDPLLPIQKFFYAKDLTSLPHFEILARHAARVSVRVTAVSFYWGSALAGHWGIIIQPPSVQKEDRTAYLFLQPDIAIWRTGD
ncbi:MAG: glycosyltransferase family 9 protein [Chthoniobacteraceae bacterium]